MPSPLAQAQYDNYWAVWKAWLMEIGLEKKEAGALTGMVLKATGSVERARRVFGAVRESRPSPEDVVRYLKQEMRDADGKTSC